MNLEFFGHACFGIRSEDVRLCVDPFESGAMVDRPSPPDRFTHWIATHAHADHSAGHVIPSATQVHAPVSVGPLRIEAHEASHDEFGGRLRGGLTDVLRITDADTGTVVVHCGDLGERPVGPLLRWLNEVPIDLLIVPLGGYFTLGADGALELAELLRPRAVLGCHAAEHGGAFAELASESLATGRVKHRALPRGEVVVGALSGWLSPAIA